jgi:hypothetical protein
MKKPNYSAIFNSEKVLIYITILIFALYFIREYYQLDYIMVQVLLPFTVYYMLHFFHKKKEYNFITIISALLLVGISILSVELFIASSEKRDWEAIQQHEKQYKDSVLKK